jgi:hypothetical protein
VSHCALRETKSRSQLDELLRASCLGHESVSFPCGILCFLQVNSWRARSTSLLCISLCLCLTSGTARPAQTRLYGSSAGAMEAKRTLRHTSGVLEVRHEDSSRERGEPRRYPPGRNADPGA